MLEPRPARRRWKAEPLLCDSSRAAPMSELGQGTNPLAWECAARGAEIAFDGRRVAFKVKDYRVEGRGCYTTMTLDVDEFVRRFLIQGCMAAHSSLVLPVVKRLASPWSATRAAP
jgi:hypothetical protein